LLQSSSSSAVAFTLSPVGNYLGYRSPKVAGANPIFSLKIMSNDTAISCDMDFRNSDSTQRVADCINNTATGTWMDTSAFTLDKHSISFSSFLYLTYSWDNYAYFKDNSGALHIIASAGIYSGTGSTLVGTTWNAPFFSVNSTTNFNADHTFSFVAGSLTSSGTYTVQGDTLITTYTNSSPDTAIYRIEDNQLMTWSIGDDFILVAR
jgi:hypothetical protein